MASAKRELSTCLLLPGSICAALALACSSRTEDGAPGDGSQAATVVAVDPAAEPSVASGFPRSITDFEGGKLRLEAAPVRILPANAAVLDYVLELVGPERLAAVGRASVLYSSVARGFEWTDEQLTGRYTGENVLAAAPDLVIHHAWQDAAVSAFVSKTGIPVLSVPEVSDFEGMLRVFEVLGQALGVEERSRAVRAALEARLAAMAGGGAWAGTRILAFSHFGSGGSCPGTGTNFDFICKLAGLVNVVSEAGIKGYADVDNERLLTLDPDWIVVGVSAADPELSASQDYLSGDAILAYLPAVRERRFLRLPAELYSSSSHVMLAAAEALLAALEGATVPGPR